MAKTSTPKQRKREKALLVAYANADVRALVRTADAMEDDEWGPEAPLSADAAVV